MVQKAKEDSKPIKKTTEEDKKSAVVVSGKSVPGWKPTPPKED